ncbi:MAG: type II secretion system F family protein [Candidatus Pacearchaeota archaeon]|nr:type II secretion system F family protein [Candidatus Pacearchaeota archaeon]
MYEALARFMHWYTEKIKKIAVFAGLKKDIEELAGFIIFLALVIGFATFIFIFLFFGWIYAFPSAIGTFFIVLGFSYLILNLKAEGRAKQVEASLPDALQLMATNLRAGLTTDKALLVSAREEFGVLNEEFKRVAKEVATGTDITESLAEMTKRIKSALVERTIQLIIFGITSGGELASLLEESAASLRQQYITRKQVYTSVLMYTIFIIIAVAFVAPLLFGLSSVLTETMQTTLAEIETPPEEVTAQLPLTVFPIKIDISLLKIFCIILLIVTSLFSSLVLGLITKGEEKEGLKYIPILTTCSLITFFTVRIIIVKLLSAFF